MEWFLDVFSSLQNHQHTEGSAFAYLSPHCSANLQVQGSPLGRMFGEFVAAAKINTLGTVPSMVRTWRRSGCMKVTNPLLPFDLACPALWTAEF